MSDVNWREPTMDGYSLVLVTRFDRTTVATVRHQVTAAARRCRMTRLDDFIVAVNEIMTNVVRHGGGIGHLRLWRGGDVVCQVIDNGSGFDAGPFLDGERPQASSLGGMGLWLARQTSDRLTVETGPEGTTIGIHGRLDPAVDS